ncbi:hypothetical protein GCM10028818_41260 [Spirosoma horti]
MNNLPKTFGEWQRQLSPQGRANWHKEFTKRVESPRLGDTKTSHDYMTMLAILETIQQELNDLV